MGKTYDFSGWATKVNIKCSDGRTIMKDAFLGNNGTRVPLVWNHQHNSPDNVLGHADLENREEGVYAYCSFNETEEGQRAKRLVTHGDVKSLSIWANQLKQNGGNVIHGVIRELSLVLAGANSGAVIDNIMVHGELSDEQAIIFNDDPIELAHADCEPKKEEKKEEKDQKTMSEETKEVKAEEGSKDETIQDVIDTMNEKQKTVMYALIGQALENEKKDDKKEEGENNTMKHNVFEKTEDGLKETTLSHSEEMQIVADAKKSGSLKDAVLAHGIEHLDYLFPDATNITKEPVMIDRDQSWVRAFMAGVHRSPMSRIKSIFADITADEARAKGYIKGNRKEEEVFTLLKRKTEPTTVYKKQAFDRDDMIDITDLDVANFVKKEMRGKLDEELARACIIGDGRSSASNDKIDELKIRPIWTDDELFTIHTKITVAPTTSDDDVAKAFIKSCIKSRKNYKGSGNPVLLTTEDMLTNCLLLTDSIGRDIYDSKEKLATKLRVRDIITVPVMENVSREVNGETRNLLGLIFNFADYNMGADKGGAVNMFDDFDIDFNKYKYLIETRCSGALTLPYSAIAVESVVTATNTPAVEEQTETEPNEVS